MTRIYCANCHNNTVPLSGMFCRDCLAILENMHGDLSEERLSEGLFCVWCFEHDAYSYHGIDGKEHVMCPNCGIIE